jgi:hypothetical protein
VSLAAEQTFLISHRVGFVLALNGCLYDDSLTPAARNADFPNTSTRFRDSTQFGAQMGASIATDAAGRITIRPSFAFSNWTGALTLADNQTIDSEVTEINIQLGLGIDY